VSYPHDSGTYTISRHDYLPFGEEIQPDTFGRARNVGYGNGDTTPQRFTAKERDPENNLDYFGARYYSGAQGRFTSPDEFTGGAMDPATGRQVQQPGPLPYADIRYPQSLNKYAYVMGNPLQWTDPDGHCAEALSCTLEGGGIGFAVGGPPGAAIGGAAGLLIGGAIVYFAVDLAVTSYQENQQAKQEQPPAGSRAGDNTTAKPAPPNAGAQDTQGKKASDNSKGERHGDGGRQLSKADKQIKALEEKLKDASRADGNRIKVKIRHIREAAEKAKKGETHWRQ
jgi:RHS repeat-associated protein